MTDPIPDPKIVGAQAEAQLAWVKEHPDHTIDELMAWYDDYMRSVNPINVWYSNGVRYEDYRRSDGSIETIKAESKSQCLGCGNVMTEDHQCQRNK